MRLSLCLPPSLPPSLPISLPPYLPVSLPPYLPTSLNDTHTETATSPPTRTRAPSLTHSRTHSLTHSLPLSLTQVVLSQTQRRRALSRNGGESCEGRFLSRIWHCQLPWHQQNCLKKRKNALPKPKLNGKMVDTLVLFVNCKILKNIYPGRLLIKRTTR